MAVSRPARIVLAHNLALVAGLVVTGASAHSLAVLAEGADYLADAAAIAVSLLAIRLESRYSKATAWAALVNGGWLLALSLLVIAGAVDRLATTTRAVHGLPVIIASGIAAAVMLGGAAILRGDVHGDGESGDEHGELNMRAVLLDTAADAAAAAGVAITGAVILVAGGSYWLDPTVAMLISAVVGYHAILLLRRIVSALRRAGQGYRPTARSS
jgi:cobalt-zinc-cadmium efflux system protein